MVENNIFIINIMTIGAIGPGQRPTSGWSLPLNAELLVELPGAVTERTIRGQ